MQGRFPGLDGDRGFEGGFHANWAFFKGAVAELGYRPSACPVIAATGASADTAAPWACSPIGPAAFATRPASRRGTFAVLGVFMRELHGHLLREPDEDEWKAHVAVVARDTLARLAEAA